MSLLQVSALSVAFPGPSGPNRVLHRLSLSLDKGEFVGLVGESGSGKSLTALSIPRLLPDAAVLSSESSVLFDGLSVYDQPEKRLQELRGSRVSMIFQEPMTSLNPVHRIEKQIGESLALHQGLTGSTQRQCVLELLEQAHIANPEQKMRAFAHELSGGERQRVMIAMALANRPRLLIADEPTTALDVTVQAEILELLVERQKELGMAILFITHDLNVVKKLADRVYVLHQGRLVESGPSQRIFTSPQADYTKELIKAAPRGEPVALRDDAETLWDSRGLSVYFPIKRGFFRRRVGWVKAVDDASFSIKAGETLGLIGESGSGKSTLGFALTQLVKPYAGRVLFEGEPLLGAREEALKAFRRRLQIMFQDPFGALSPRLSIGDIIAEGLDIHFSNLGEDERNDALFAIMERVGLDPNWRWRFAHELSGGQRQRVSLARALILKPRLLILDEPTSALDRALQIQILDLLKDLQKSENIAYIFISHDLAVVRSIAHQLMVLKDGRVVEQGDAARIFAKPKQAYTRRLLAAALSVLPDRGGE